MHSVCYNAMLVMSGNPCKGVFVRHTEASVKPLLPPNGDISQVNLLTPRAI